MKTSISFSRYHPYGMTVLELCGRDTDIQIKVLSRLGKRERRAFIRAFFGQIRPLLENLDQVMVEHSGDGIVRRKRSRERQLKSVQSAPVDSRSGEIGFEIRMKRLSLGLSQAELAQKVGITRSHLSEIERGLYFPHARTRAGLQEVLEIPLT